MRRRLTLLNLLLVAALAGSVWQLRQNHLAAETKRKGVLQQKAQPNEIPVYTPAEAVPAMQAGNYLPVAQQMLFAKDRNPNVIVDAPPPKPVPVFPVAYGVMALGDSPSVILSEKPGSQKAYRAGDKVGQFTLKSVSTEEIVFVWDDGQEFKKTLAELKEKPGQAAPAAAARPNQEPERPREALITNTHAVTPPEKVDEAQKPKDGGPGIDIGGAARACAPGDDSPAGTVMGGYRKVVGQSPFGRTCRWEPAR